MPNLCIVVDASISRAAGGGDATHPAAKQSRLFLLEFLNQKFLLAINEPIRMEWDKHQSRFSMEWRAAMLRKGRIRKVSNHQNHELRRAVEGFSLDPHIGEIMMKDVHLLEAALVSDQRIASLDETVRWHFARLSVSFTGVGPVLWTNPSKPSDQSVEWLERGAPDERDKRLKPY